MRIPRLMVPAITVLRMLAATALTAVWLSNGVPAHAEVFELKTGHKLEGDVLKQQGDVLLVDIGVDVIKVPLSQIKSRRASQDSANPPLQEKKHQLYRTAQLPRRSVKD